MRLEVHRIREDNRYGRIRLSYRRMSRRPVSTSRSTSASGDAITPGATDLKFPTLLGDMPAPNLLAYPTETIVREDRSDGRSGYLEQPHEGLHGRRGGGPAGSGRRRHARCGTLAPDEVVALSERFVHDAKCSREMEAFATRNRPRYFESLAQVVHSPRSEIRAAPGSRLESGCAWVASRCCVLPRSAKLR